MIRVAGMGCGLLFLLGWATGCRGERVVFSLTPVVPISKPAQPLVNSTKSVAQLNDSVATKCFLAAPISFKRRRQHIVVVPSTTTYYKTLPQPRFSPRISFIETSDQCQQPIAASAEKASNGWESFVKFLLWALLLMSLPIGMIAALVSAIFNIGFWDGVAYVALGYVALIVLFVVAALVFNGLRK